MRRLSQIEEERASRDLRVASSRWLLFVTQTEVPDDLKHWDGTETAPGHPGVGNF
jgi:hypothetical protein